MRGQCRQLTREIPRVRPPFTRCISGHAGEFRQRSAIETRDAERSRRVGEEFRFGRRPVTHGHAPKAPDHALPNQRMQRQARALHEITHGTGAGLYIGDSPLELAPQFKCNTARAVAHCADLFQRRELGVAGAQAVAASARPSTTCRRDARMSNPMSPPSVMAMNGAD